MAQAERVTKEHLMEKKLARMLGENSIFQKRVPATPKAQAVRVKPK